MARQTWVYPPGATKGILKEDWLEMQHQGELFGMNGAEHKTHHMISGDLPDFVSPVDGKLYSGRAGLREHNLRNNVVNNSELTGLKPLAYNSDTRSSSQIRRDKQDRKERIIHLVNERLRRHG